ncbi:hypothetical protein DL95DRAFT_392827 [Leptodontidium sp. 2 PMI_412]|nr:hypothetical protein DL95DRAFT_392827 [Leptodontidium sp. 2 PMI_412]
MCHQDCSFELYTLVRRCHAGLTEPPSPLWFPTISQPSTHCRKISLHGKSNKLWALCAILFWILLRPAVSCTTVQSSPCPMPAMPETSSFEPSAQEDSARGTIFVRNLGDLVRKTVAWVSSRCGLSVPMVRQSRSELRLCGLRQMISQLVYCRIEIVR